MIGHLQRLYQRNGEKGLVLLGINCTDSKAAAVAFLRQNNVTFPNIIDTSQAARKVVLTEYQTPPASAVPLEYIIDRDGKIVVGWYGSGGNTGQRALQELGIR